MALQFATIDDVRKLLPGVPSGDNIDDLIANAIQRGDSEMMGRLAARVNLAAVTTAPVMITISAYLGASVYLASSMVAGQENDAPKLAEYYRRLAEQLLEEILEGAPILDENGEAIEADAIVPAAAKSWLVLKVGKNAKKPCKKRIRRLFGAP